MEPVWKVILQARVGTVKSFKRVDGSSRLKQILGFIIVLKNNNWSL